MKMQKLGAMALLGAGLLVFAGCKSAPPLSQQDALAIVQAKYNQAPPESVSFPITDLGMRKGIVAKYWAETKKYPNGYWADFEMTPDGKKVIKLSSGGDTIQWHPESSSDKSFVVTASTVATSRHKAKDMSDLLDLGGGVKTATYSESDVLDALPSALKDIIEDPGNKISTKRTATFNLVDNQWQLQSIQ
jgi:hypothetical protein